VVERDQSLGLLQVEQLDHLPVEADDALALVGGQRESFDHFFRVTEFGLTRGEDPVGGFDLRRVDQGLAVETDHPALFALGREPGVVVDVVIDAVDCRQAIRTSRHQRRRQ